MRAVKGTQPGPLHESASTPAQGAQGTAPSPAETSSWHGSPTMAEIPVSSDRAADALGGDLEGGDEPKAVPFEGGHDETDGRDHVAVYRAATHGHRD